MVADRVVVTGGLGFVGHALTEQLVRRGAEVLVVDDESLGRRENLASEIRDNVRVETIDILDVDRVANVFASHKPDRVFHLAAIHFIPLCDREPRRAIRVNVEGTQSILDAARTSDVGGLVLASTAAVYAPSDDPHTEDSTIGPTDIYGLTKLWDEHLGNLFHQQTQTPVGVVRLFNAAGPGESNPHLIPTVIQQLRQGPDLKLGNLATERDYIHVHDAAAGFIAMAEGLTHDAVITANVGSEDAVSGEVLVRMIGDLMNVQPVVHQDPARMRKSDRPRLISDCGRAQELLGWKTERSLVDALRDAIERPLANDVAIA